MYENLLWETTAATATDRCTQYTDARECRDAFPCIADTENFGMTGILWFLRVIGSKSPRSSPNYSKTVSLDRLYVC